MLHSLAAFVLIIAVSQLIDWVFSGASWTRSFYASHPEVWRPVQKNSAEANRVVWKSLCIAALFSLAYIAFYIVLQPGIIFGSGAARALAVSGVSWIALVVPYAATQHLFVKYHVVTSASFALGWLCKLCAASLIITYLI